MFIFYINVPECFLNKKKKLNSVAFSPQAKYNKSWYNSNTVVQLFTDYILKNVISWDKMPHILI
jgi:hypothetical protein